MALHGSLDAFLTVVGHRDLQSGTLQNLDIETRGKDKLKGNIYKGIVTRVEPSLQAAFVDYGAERHGFLQRHEIHSDYYQETPSGKKSIKDIIKRGQEVLVQITKDPILKKGAMLTTYISLPGRYLVLRPGSDNRGVSRKIESEDERQRLKDIISKLKIPEEFGMIVWTEMDPEKGFTDSATTGSNMTAFNQMMKRWTSWFLDMLDIMTAWPVIAEHSELVVMLGGIPLTLVEFRTVLTLEYDL